MTETTVVNITSGGNDDEKRVNQQKLGRRRRLRICLIITGAVLLLLILTLIVLFFTVLRVRDPTATVLSSNLTGVAPRVTLLPTPSIQLNVTLSLDIQVHNPNPAAFTYEAGHTVLSYRGAHVGDADVEPGRIPSRGDGLMEMSMTVEADRFAGMVGDVVADIEAGEIALDTDTVIPGRVKILGLFSRHAVARSKCHVVVGVPGFKVKSQDCENSTQL